MRRFLLLFCFIAVLMQATFAMAITVNSELIGDGSIASHMPDYKMYGLRMPYLWIGNNSHGEFRSYVRFDVSNIHQYQDQGFSLKSLTLNAFNNYNKSESNKIFISLGNNDTIPLQDITWRNSHESYGDPLSSTLVGPEDLGTYVSLDLTNINPDEFLDSVLTLFLSTDNSPFSVHDFQRGSGFTNVSIPFLSAEMAPVPEPSTIILLSAGLLVLGFYRRKVSVS